MMLDLVQENCRRAFDSGHDFTFITFLVTVMVMTLIPIRNLNLRRKDIGISPFGLQTKYSRALTLTLTLTLNLNLTLTLTLILTFTLYLTLILSLSLAVANRDLGCFHKHDRNYSQIF